MKLLGRQPSLASDRNPRAHPLSRSRPQPRTQMLSRSPCTSHAYLYSGHIACLHKLLVLALDRAGRAPGIRAVRSSCCRRHIVLCPSSRLGRAPQGKFLQCPLPGLCWKGPLERMCQHPTESPIEKIVADAPHPWSQGPVLRPRQANVCGEPGKTGHHSSSCCTSSCGARKAKALKLVWLLLAIGMASTSPLISWR